MRICGDNIEFQIFKLKLQIKKYILYWTVEKKELISYLELSNYQMCTEYQYRCKLGEIFRTFAAAGKGNLKKYNLCGDSDDSITDEKCVNDLSSVHDLDNSDKHSVKYTNRYLCPKIL